MQGLQVTGFPASGTPPTIQSGANPTGINIPTTLMSAQITTTATMPVNLNSSSKTPTVTTFDPTNADSYNLKGPITVYDSQGNAHDMNVFYVKSATNNNTWDVYTQDSSVTGSTATKAAQMVFNQNGSLQGVYNYTFNTTTGNYDLSTTANTNPAITVTSGTLNGATAATFSLSFLNSMQQNTTSAVVSTSQNGYKPGSMVSYTINDDGTVVGSYSNEQKQVLGQIVLANFANNEGLKSEGDNVWSATNKSGVALLGTAGTGNFGSLTNGALEASNVDLSKELVNMIVAQRNYQSNAQTIKTQDQILNTLVNLR